MMRIVSNWVLAAVMLCRALPVRGAEPVPSREPPGKFFVSDIQLNGTCVKEVSADGLRTMLASAIPRDVLKLRNLQYEDIRPYQDLSGWAPEQFSLRDPKNVMAVMRKMDMKKMLRLEVSCLPVAHGMPPYILTGRLIDVSEMDRILTCQDAVKLGGRSSCHTSGDVYDAATFAFVEMQTFSDFLPSVRHLFARLLQVPEIVLESQRTVYEPGEPISLVFSARRNEGRDGSYDGSSVAARELSYSQWVVKLDSDKFENICAAPETYWDDLGCDKRSRCNGSIPFMVFDLKGGRVVKTMIPKKDTSEAGTRGGDRIVISAPAVGADYLIRAQVTAKEGDAEIRSTPIYRCLHVRARRHHWGLSPHLSVHGGYSHYVNAETISHIASQPVYGSGLDLFYMKRLTSRSIGPLQGALAGIGVGYTYLCGTMSSCAGSAVSTPYSTAHILELRLLGHPEIYRGKHFIIGLPVALGLGFERLDSYPKFDRDGFYGTGSFSLGASAGTYFPAGGLECELGLLFDLRQRLASGTAMPVSGSIEKIDAAAIPDTLLGGLVQLTVRLAVPVKPRAP